MTQEIIGAAAVISASFLLNAVFLKRLLNELHLVTDWIRGTPDRRGLADRVLELERHAGLADQVESYNGEERRRRERRLRWPRDPGAPG